MFGFTNNIKYICIVCPLARPHVRVCVCVCRGWGWWWWLEVKVFIELMMRNNNWVQPSVFFGEKVFIEGLVMTMTTNNISDDLPKMNN